MRQSPVCVVEYGSQVYNVGEEIERYTCFDVDPRAEEDIECRSKVSNDTFDCFQGCTGNPPISEGNTYKLKKDRRCTYRIDFWDKTTTVRKLLFGD